LLAAVVTSQGTVQVQEVGDPSIGDFEVLCRMLYGSICAGTDTHIVNREFDDILYPSIVGHESIGEVVKVGPNVKNFSVGDHITRVSAQPSTAGMGLSWGGMCEYGVARDHEAMKSAGLPREQWDSFRVNQVIPSGLLDDVYEPMFITWRETLSFILRLGITRGAKVLVSGSGANGLALAAMSNALGAQATIIGSANRSWECISVASSYIDYRDDNGLASFIEQARGTMDFLIDATGNSAALNKLIPTLTGGGSVAVYGMDELEGYTLYPMLAGGSFSFYNDGYDEAETHSRVVDLVQRNELDPAIWIDRKNVFEWSNINEAFTAAASRTQIKPVVRLTTMASQMTPN
jgi:D-arabinose 1-dehydrogenase-like Zn-dependent alcohol dehydrogenase